VTGAGQFIGSFGYALGERRPIEDFAAGAPPGTLDLLREQGLAHYRIAAEGMTAIWEQALRRAMMDSPVACETDLVIFANSNPLWTRRDEEELAGVLKRAGVAAARLLSVGLQECASFPAVLELAGAMMDARALEKVVVLVSGQARESPHLNLKRSTVFSDGAACFSLTRTRGAFRVCSVETRSMALTADEETATGILAAIKQRFHILRQVIQACADRANLPVELLRAVTGSQLNEATFHLFQDALPGVEASRIRSGRLAELGHVHGCDGIIGLCSLQEGPDAVQEGDHVLVLGWAPNTAAAAILQRA
jgi:3-Oxoacyl-[acyl-carrier-protein (ACP)] synthase III